MRATDAIMSRLDKFTREACVHPADKCYCAENIDEISATQIKLLRPIDGGLLRAMAWAFKADRPRDT
jgi:hypothetical protein